MMEQNAYETAEMTAAEISGIWTAYQNTTVMVCGLSHFLQHVDDTDIKKIMEDYLSLTKKLQAELTDLFTKDGHPLPQGFTDRDVNLEAPRLYSDRIYLEVMIMDTSFNIAAYGLALTQIERADINNFFSNVLDEMQRFHNWAKKLSKEKGLHTQYPQIPKADQIEFVKSDSFLTGWFGERRPLLGVEITALVLNTQRNALGQAIIAGFAQVAKNKEVRNYFEKGRDIAKKHFNVFSKLLQDDYIADGARNLTSEVTDSTTSPFSDKLMLNLVTMLIGSGMGQYGTSMSVSPRHDLGLTYTRLIAEIAKYSNKGANILIENGWMEQPPIAADRKNLAK